MAKYRIAWLEGDGVGKEVMEAARLVLDALQLDAEYLPGDIGWTYWCAEGDAFPQRTVDLLKNTDCALFGAITSKPREEADRELDPSLKGKGFSYFSPIVRMRQMFDLHTNLRPCKAFPGNPLNYRDDIDITVFRENTEGLYVGLEWHPLPADLRDAYLRCSPKMKRFANVPLEDIAVSTRLVTRSGCRSIARQAFEYAKKYGKQTVCLVEKPNVLRETGGLMTREVRKVAQDYPGIRLTEANIDAMCMWLVKNPQDYQVLVAENMFGDIISDLAAQLVGGLGFAASGNIGDKYAVFEPTHGSAPKYAGLYKVNPIATILAARLMLDWLGEKDRGDRIEAAVAKVIADGQVRTYDMGGPATTLDMARAVVEAL
jgi:3-isopropylmalate dehydrogenase